jgi:hypothetical protein
MGVTMTDNENNGESKTALNYYVYFIEAGNHKKSPVKIGVTTNIERRIYSLQVGNPYKLKCKALIFCIDKADAFKLESYLHYRLKDHKINGEWFRSEYFKLSEILESYDIKSDQKHSIKKSFLQDYTSLKLRRMSRELNFLRSENEELKAENDSLIDQINSYELR